MCNDILNIRRLPQRSCTGCNLCMLICPFGAIQMTHTKEGFVIPSVDSLLCRECGKCAKLCPSVHPLEKKHPIDTKLCVSKDSIINTSASGGLFITIAKHFIENLHGVVYGVVFDNEFTVKHTEATTIEQLRPMQNSKYVQSIVGNTYTLAKDNLQRGKYVLFSGTPCQIAALKSYLGKDYETLLTIDIVCHGVPNQEFWKRNLKLEGNGVIGYRFRTRQNRQKGKTTLEATMLSKSGSKQIRWQDDPYYCSFIKNESFRESCYKCQYANQYRVSDITMGDCDSVLDYPDFYPTESKSIALINTDKGLAFWESIKHLFEFTHLDYEKEAEVNTPLRMPSHRPKRRDVIYQDLASLPWFIFKYKYTEHMTIRRFLGVVKSKIIKMLH